MKPSLPKLSTFAHSFEKIDERQIYSNNGPLFLEFRERLEAWLHVRQTHDAPVKVALTSSGTTAIELALRSSRLKGKSLCLVPSFTFVATVHAIRNAGLEPLLADISALTLALSPDYVRELNPKLLDQLAAIVVVSPFGAPVDLAAWEKLSIITGIPVVIDAAAAITTLTEGSKIPVCVSLHATKTLAIGEGGAVISSDEGLIESITQQTSFGFAAGNNESMTSGGNYRLSEYSCAIGLAALDQIAKKEAELFEIADSYIKSIKNSGNESVRLQNGLGDNWVSSTLNLILSRETHKDTISNWDERKIPWRRWWGLGAGTHHAFKDCSALSLEVTEDIARRVVGVPFYIGISDDDIESVVECTSL